MCAASSRAKLSTLDPCMPGSRREPDCCCCCCCKGTPLSAGSTRPLPLPPPPATFCPDALLAAARTGPVDRLQTRSTGTAECGTPGYQRHNPPAVPVSGFAVAAKPGRSLDKTCCQQLLVPVLGSQNTSLREARQAPDPSPCTGRLASLSTHGTAFPSTLTLLSLDTHTWVCCQPGQARPVPW